jgi:hypothetical protein
MMSIWKRFNKTCIDLGLTPARSRAVWISVWVSGLAHKNDAGGWSYPWGNGPTEDMAALDLWRKISGKVVSVNPMQKDANIFIFPEYVEEPEVEREFYLETETGEQMWVTEIDLTPYKLPVVTTKTGQRYRLLEFPNLSQGSIKVSPSEGLAGLVTNPVNWAVQEPRKE